MNGESYKGGQFLPNTENTVKGAQNGTKIKATRKQQVAPYVWEVPPAEGLRAIFRHAGQTLRYDWKTNTMQLNDVNWDWFDQYGAGSRERAQASADKWNAGERWE
jgi:hypothetical protein